VLDELRPLEKAYAEVLVVIGVHSPKFEHEKDPAGLAAAIERHGVTHPVLDDPSMRMWRQYAVKAWPTLIVVDPQGYVVASMAGEGHAEGLTRILDDLIATHEAAGTLRRGHGPYVAAPTHPTGLRFPSKALALPGGAFLVSDSAQHRLVELAPDADTVVRQIGSGRRGRSDGAPSQACFNEPSGLCLLPRRVAEIAGYDVVAADTVNHLLRGVRLDTGEVRRVAGSGRQWRSTVDFDPHDALAVDLSSPWDVAWHDERVIVAMAGIHQLWWFDPIKRTAGMYAGTTVEALRDGPLEQVWMAQPSGLSVSPESISLESVSPAAATLWVVDSESSALRWVRDSEMHTAVGQGLFDFGHLDGPADRALLQHPLGVLAMPDGSVLVADTYNGAVRRYADGAVATVATGLSEPSDLVLDADGTVVVVESAAHRLTRLVPDALDSVARAPQRTQRPVIDLAPGEVQLEVIFEPLPDHKLDESFGPPIRLDVSASPPVLLASGTGESDQLLRRLVLSSNVDSGVLQIVVRVATCDTSSPHAACHLTRQDWGVPVQVRAGGASHLPLVLRSLGS
jgi:hypothetical protein